MGYTQSGECVERYGALIYRREEEEEEEEGW